MLFVPIGQEDSEVRRLPWVSIVVMALMIVGFLVFGQPFGGGFRTNLRKRHRELVVHLVRHPYLTVSPQVAPFLGEDFLEALREERAVEPGKGEMPRQLVPVGPEMTVQTDELRRLENEFLGAIHQNPAYRLGFVPAKKSLGTAVSSIFLHVGWFHLIGNLLFFFATGPFLEDVYGRLLFALLFLASGIVAALVHAAHFPGSPVPVIGASGAIAGVMGAFLVRLAKSRILFLFLPVVFFPFWRYQLLIPAFVVLPLWFGQQLGMAWFSSTSLNVAVWAHVGGFVFGLAAAALLKLGNVEERWVHPGIEKQISWQQNAALVRASTARHAGDFEKARRDVARALRQEPESLDAWRMSFDLAVQAGLGDEALRSAERLLALYVRKNEDLLAQTLVADVLREIRPSLTPRFGLAAGRLLERVGETHEALALHEEVAARFPDDAAALQSLARVAILKRKVGDGAGVEAAVARARRHPLFSGEWEAAVSPDQLSPRPAGRPHGGTADRGRPRPPPR